MSSLAIKVDIFVNKIILASYLRSGELDKMTSRYTDVYFVLETRHFKSKIIGQNSQKSANNFYRSTSQTRHIIINATCHPARPPARLDL